MYGSSPEEIRERIKTWNVIYPAYIDSKKTTQEGRRIPKGKAVENPTVMEMSEILQYYKIQHIVEMDRTYSRDILNPGRVKILLKDPSGKMLYPAIKSKKDLMLKMGELIPKLKSRVGGGATAGKASASSEEAVGKKKKKKR